MNFQTIFLQTGISSIKICLQNINFLAIMCHSLYSVNFSRANDTFRWRMLSFQPQVSNKKLIITKSVERQVKNVFLKVHKFHSKTAVLESLFNKVSHLFSPANLLKRDFNTGAFL